MNNIFVRAGLSVLILVAGSQAHADVIITSGNIQGVTPFNIETSPNVGDRDIFVGRVNIINDIIIGVDGGLDVTAEGVNTSVSTNDRLFIGVQQNSTGVVNVIGDGSAGSASINVQSAITVGGQSGSFMGSSTNVGGIGTLDISAGGHVIIGNPQDNFDFGALFIGGNGSESNFNEDINGPGNLDGTVNVSGQGSLLHASFVGIGNPETAASGLLSVSDGGKVRISSALDFGGGKIIDFGFLHVSENSQVVVDGTGSSIVADALLIGDDRNNPSIANIPTQFSIVNGGQFVAENFDSTSRIGNGGNAKVLISGSGSEFINGETVAGSLVESFANVLIGSTQLIGFDASGNPISNPGNGAVTVEQGGRFRVGGDIFIGSNLDTSINGAEIVLLDRGMKNSVGLLTVRSSGVVEAQNIFVDAGGRLQGGGGLIDANVVVRGGVVAPGLSPGMMVINGDLIIDTGVLQLEEEGGLKDLLVVSGVVRIGPNAMIEFLFETLPAVIDIAEFFTVGGPIEFEPGFMANNIMVLSSTAGGVGQTVDVMWDGITQTFVAGAGANVPEPATILIFGVGLAGLGFARRRKAS